MLIHDLIAFEDNAELLKYRFKSDIIIWQYVRQFYYTAALNKLNEFTAAHDYQDNSGFVNKLQTKYRQLTLNPLKEKQQFDILMLAITGESASIKIGNKYFNNRFDFFAKLYEDNTYFIDGKCRGKIAYPRALKNYGLINSLSSKAYYKAKYLSKTNASDQENIQNLIQYTRTHFHVKFDEVFYLQIYTYLDLYSRMIPHMKVYLHRLFEKMQPKVFIIEDASNGDQAHITKFAKDFGIKVVEQQHGVMRNNFIYNYGKAIFESVEYKKMLPDYIFTFGEYWSEQTHTPSKSIVIGRPFLTDLIRNNNNNLTDKKNITIFSDGTLSEQFIELTKKLRELFAGKGYRIIHRLHPGEVGFNRHAELEKFDDIELSYKESAYDLLDRSHHIVGCASTVMIEALIYKKPVYILNNSSSEMYVSDKIGSRFKTAEELYELIVNETGQIIQDIDYFWCPDWEQNYKNFLRENVGLNLKF